MSWLVMWVKPMPFCTATAPHGSPTQKARQVPVSMLATICGGGIGMILVVVPS